MSNRLEEYINGLTDEQINALIDHAPKIIEAIEQEIHESNMQNKAEKIFSKIPARYSLRLDEVALLMGMARKDIDGAWDAIKIAFSLGFRAGHRATKRNVIKNDI